MNASFPVVGSIFHDWSVSEGRVVLFEGSKLGIWKRVALRAEVRRYFLSGCFHVSIFPLCSYEFGIRNKAYTQNRLRSRSAYRRGSVPVDAAGEDFGEVETGAGVGYFVGRHGVAELGDKEEVGGAVALVAGTSYSEEGAVAGTGAWWG